MKINPKDFRVREGAIGGPGQMADGGKAAYKSKEDYHTLLSDHVDRLSKQQQLLYASNSHAILLIFQAMDAAGKDGAIST